MLGGVDIAGGFYYIGERSRTGDFGAERWLVRRSLPIAKGEAAFRGPLSPYPNYGDFSPAARRAYLEWLASDRSDPNADIGFVWLYFYGLEARLFAERGTDRDAVAAEVKRLSMAYAHEAGIAKATATLNAALAVEREFVKPALIIDADRGVELPLDIRVALGRKIASSHTLTSVDALLWASRAPGLYFRTPALRCPDEFQALWHAEFDKLYPKGLHVAEPKTRLDPTYRAASGSFVAPVVVPGGPLPDIAVLEATFAKLKDLAATCSDELDAFSRFVGRYPERRESVAALTLLPSSQRVMAISTTFAPRLGILMADNTRASVSVVEACDLFQLQPAAQSRLDAATIELLEQALDCLNVGFEPDPRFGAQAPLATGQIVLFRAEGGAPVTANNSTFAETRVALEVAALAAMVDNDAATARSRISHVATHFTARSDLEASERLRLEASGEASIAQPPAQIAVFKKLGALEPEARQIVAQAAVDATRSGTGTTVAQVKFLERLYGVLGIEPKELYSALNRDFTVSRATSSPVQPGSENSGTHITLDNERLAQKRADTEAVAKLLTDIFVDVPVPEIKVAAVSKESFIFAGLDPRHGRLLDKLATKASIERSIFDAEARALELLPDGALERINDWALDQFDEAILEDGENVVFVASLRADLEKLRVSE